MNPPDLIANRIVELLRPDSYDAEEEKKLRERDERRDKKRKGEITLIDFPALFCHHQPFIVHSNGAKECQSICQRLWVPERLAHLYPNNPRVILIKEKEE